MTPSHRMNGLREGTALAVPFKPAKSRALALEAPKRHIRSSMPQLLRKTNFGVLLLAALAAGTLVVPAVAAQSMAATAKKPALKSPGASTTHAAPSSTAQKTSK